MTATVLGGGLISGAATATRASPPGEARGRRSTLGIASDHDHEADDHFFELDSREVPAGWTTIEFENRTDHTHFAYLIKLPEQALIDAKKMGTDPLSLYVDTVTRPFQFFWDSQVPGKTPDKNDLSDRYESFFAPWFGDVLFYGGAGLTSGHNSSTTTVDLDSGKYIVECYVKNGNNDFHGYLGMTDLLTVTRDEADAPEPEATLDLSLSTDGLEVADEVRPGRHVVGVRVRDQTTYENLVGHDVHLVRLDEGTTASDVNDWMNWADPAQFVSDGSEPETFLGGVPDIWTTDLPRTGYFHVNLKPGDYVWVAEVPDPKNEGLLQEFTVPFGENTGNGK